jgi:hypothetical protein
LPQLHLGSRLVQRQGNQFYDAWLVDLDYKGKPVIRHLSLDYSLLYQKAECGFTDSKKMVFNF